MVRLCSRSLVYSSSMFLWDASFIIIEASGRREGHAGILVDLMKEFKEIEMPSDHMETIFWFESKFKAVIPTREQWESRRCPKEGSVTVFTDGSKTSEGTGSGIYCEEREIALSIPLGISATVFQSEIVAISECCRILTEQTPSNETVVVCTDSESAIGALTSYKLSAKSVLRCREGLEALSENNEVFLVWAPGHSGIEGNEKADELARRGSQMGLIGPEPTIGVHAKFVANLLKRKTEEEHQRAWDGLQASEGILGGMRLEHHQVPPRIR